MAAQCTLYAKGCKERERKRVFFNEAVEDLIVIIVLDRCSLISVIVYLIYIVAAQCTLYAKGCKEE